MKDRFVVLYLGRRGAGPVYTFEMTRALCNIGKNVLVVLSCYIENRDRWNDIENKYDNLTIEWFKTYRSVGGFFISLFNSKERQNLIRRILAFSPNCIYVPMLSMLDSYVLRHLTCVKERIITIHDVKQHLGEENRVVQYLYDSTIKLATKIVVLSEKFIDEVSIKYNIDTNNILHVPHANFSYYVTHKPVFENATGALLFFGRIHKYKGLDLLLKGFEIALQRFPWLRLTIAGNGSFSHEEMSLINKLAERVVVMQGWIDDAAVESLFEGTDIVVLSYKEASQSGVIPLAYSMGRAVLATDVGGLREQIAPDTFEMLKELTPECLAESLCQIYESPELILKANKNAYNYACNELSWTHSAKCITNVI